MVTGFVWGLCRSLRPEPRDRDYPSLDTLNRLKGRLENVESEMARLSAQSAAQSAEKRAGDFSACPTRREMSEALDAVERRIESGVAEQLGRQMLAIGSLRAMIVDTDALLERVLERLEASAPEPSMRQAADHAEDDRAENDAAEDRIMPLKEPARGDAARRETARKEPVRT
jgi:hypothetical protein